MVRGNPLLWVVAGAVAPGAAAASVSGAEAGTPNSAVGIEEVVVSARKRNENLQNVGLAVTAIGGDSLQRLRIGDLRDLVQQVPGLQVQTSFGMTNPAIFLRGVGVNDLGAIASGAVGLYHDGVYVGSPSAQLFQFFDLERVEVLRGPQGTLYGRNTPAGAINFVSRTPRHEFDARLRASVGRFDEAELEGAVGGSMSNTVAARLAFVSNQRDGHVRNFTLATDDSDIDNWAARASVWWQPVESVEAILRLHTGRSNAGPKRNKSQGLLDPDSVAAGLPGPCPTPERLGTCSDPLGYVDTPDPYTGNWNRAGNEDVDRSGASATVTWARDDIVLTSVTSVSDSGRSILHDADASPNQLLEINWKDDSREWSQELRLRSAKTSAPTWLAGIYYYHRDVMVEQVNDVFRALRPLVGFDPMQGVFTVKTSIDSDVSAYSVFAEYADTSESIEVFTVKTPCIGSNPTSGRKARKTSFTCSTMTSRW